MDNHIDPTSDCMKSYILLTEAFVQTYLSQENAEEVEPEIVDEAEPGPRLIDPTEIEDVIFRLSSFQEPAGGDYALGVEMGVQMAIEILENLLRRNKEET